MKKPVAIIMMLMMTIILTACTENNNEIKQPSFTEEEAVGILIVSNLSLDNFDDPDSFNLLSMNIQKHLNSMNLKEYDVLIDYNYLNRLGGKVRNQYYGTVSISEDEIKMKNKYGGRTDFIKNNRDSIELDVEKIKKNLDIDQEKLIEIIFSEDINDE